MKKLAKKSAPQKKGDEPVRVGRKAEQKVKNFIEDPKGWMDPNMFKSGVKKNDEAKKFSKIAKSQANKLVAESKKKYGTNFVVGIGPDAQVYVDVKKSPRRIKK